jgi:uncharacterized protein YdiU (UPF0061 family)
MRFVGMFGKDELTRENEEQQKVTVRLNADWVRSGTLDSNSHTSHRAVPVGKHHVMTHAAKAPHFIFYILLTVHHVMILGK